MDVHLLDDGFQHLQLHRDLNLLVVDATNPFGGGLRRADVCENPWMLFAARTPSFLPNRSGSWLRRTDREVSALQARYSVFLVHQRLVSLRKLGEEKVLPLEALSDVDVVAFAGIGNPSQFLKTLGQAGIRVHPVVFFSGSS